MTLHLHLIILPIVAIASLVPGLLLLRRYYKIRKKNTYGSYYDHDGLAASGFVITGLGVCLMLGVIIALIPFQPKYWFLTQHKGTIATISNRFVDGSGDISGSTYTLTLEGDPTPRVVTDSRILGLQVGDQVDLTCSLEWVYGGSDKSNCYMRSF